ncbi:MAG: P1 family peptidase [Actinomycetota bacterium]
MAAPRLRTGRHNHVVDVAGIEVGHFQQVGDGWCSGTTVVLAPQGTVGGVDVRGGGPGTREPDCLAPTTMVSTVDAICLSGGSAYGLDTASGVVAWLAERNRGLKIGPDAHHVVPIVPAAVLFDLGVGGNFKRQPTAEFGRRASDAATSNPTRLGNVGAGTGARSGGLKGGIGSASLVLENGITVAALVALNAAGSPIDPKSGELFGARYGVGDEFEGLRTPTKTEVAAWLETPRTPPPLNTTLAVIATDARLSKHECSRVAAAGHDGMARAISPIHLYTDGDTVFTLATGAKEFPEGEAPKGAIRTGDERIFKINEVMTAGADCVARAIVHAMLAAETFGQWKSYRDVFPSSR